MSDLSNRLRLAGMVVDSDDTAELLLEAADALEALEGDVVDETQSAEAPQTVE